LWIKDIVDLSWEIQRLRRFKALLIELVRQKCISISGRTEMVACRRSFGDGSQPPLVWQGRALRNLAICVCAALVLQAKCSVCLIV